MKSGAQLRSESAAADFGAEISIVRAPAWRPNSMSDALSPTTTEVDGSKFSSAAARSINPCAGFRQVQFAAGAWGHT